MGGRTFFQGQVYFPVIGSREGDTAGYIVVFVPWVKVSETLVPLTAAECPSEHVTEQRGTAGDLSVASGMTIFV